MTSVVQLTEELLRALPPGGRQAGLAARLDDPAYVATLCQPGRGWAAVDDDRPGMPVMIGGVVPVCPGRGLAWFAAAPHLGLRHWRLALRVIRHLLRSLPDRRIEATVLCGHERGCRWAEALGFEREGLMRRFGEAGEDFWLYARVKPDGVR